MEGQGSAPKETKPDEGMTKAMLLMAETLWRFSLQDIESTLRQARHSAFAFALRPALAFVLRRCAIEFSPTPKPMCERNEPEDWS